MNDSTSQSGKAPGTASSGDSLLRQLDVPRTIAEIAGVGILVNNGDGHLVFINPEAERMLGYSFAELRGKSIHEVLHYKYPDGRPFPIADCPLGHVYEDGRGIRGYEGVFWHKDGSPVHVLCSNMPILENGKPIGDVISVQDISSRKRAEEALRASEVTLRSFYESSPLLMGVVELRDGDDSDIIHVYDNPATDQFYGHPVGSSAGKTSQSFGAPPKVIGIWAAHYRMAQRKGEPVRFEYEHHTAEGPVVLSTVVTCIGPSARPGFTRFTYTAEDVTIRKQAEDRVRERTRQLDLLARTSQKLILSKEMDATLLAGVFKEIGQFLNMEMFCHYRPAAEAGVLRLTVSGGISDEERTLLSTLRHGELLCGRMAESHLPIIVEDLQNSVEPGCEALASAGAQSYVGFPLLAGGELQGTLAFISRSQAHFRNGEVQVIQMLCDQIAMTLERTRLIQELRTGEEQFRLASDAAGAIVYDVDLFNARPVRVHGLKRGTGFHPEKVLVTGDWWHGRIHPDDIARHHMEQDELVRSGTKRRMQYRFQHADGRWLHFEDAAEIIRGPDRTPLRMVGTVIDITERKQAEEQRMLLIHELNHRVKNTLATVQSIALQTFKGAEPGSRHIEAFEARLMALASAHDILTRTNWEGAMLGDIVERALHPFQDKLGGSFTLTGAPVRLSSRATLALALGLHELATNAAKYGALSQPGGSVAISWQLSRDAASPEFALQWRESGGPLVEKPTRQGFGTRLISKLLAADLGGTITLDYAPEGVVCIVSAPYQAGL